MTQEDRFLFGFFWGVLSAILFAATIFGIIVYCDNKTKHP